MKENEMIIVDSIPDNRRNDIIIAAIQNAIVSSINSEIGNGAIDINQHIINKAEPEIAKRLFSFFCTVNKIKLDSDYCALLNDKKWNIKYMFQNIESGITFSHLYTLIPENVNAQNKFISLDLNEEQEKLLKKVSGLIKQHDQEGISFVEDLFWAEFNNKGGDINFALNYNPQLLIMCYGNGNNPDIETENRDLENPPSLLALFPHLKENIKYGFIKKTGFQG